MKDAVFQIEEQFPEAREIRVNGTEMWPFIRIMFRYLIVEKNLSVRSGNGAAGVGAPSPSLWQRISQKILPNFRLWFRKCDVVIFSNNLEKRKIDGKFIDKLSEGIVRNPVFPRTLTINYFSNMDITVRDLANKSSVDALLLEKLIRLKLKYTRLRIEEKDRLILDRIIAAYGLDWAALEYRIRFMLAKAAVIKRVLRILRPKIVFTSCYSYFAEVWAAKQLGIKTVELQHGVISPLHPGYESLFPLNKEFTAQHLFVFGRNSIKGLDDNLVSKDNACIVGNYYLDTLEEKRQDKTITEIMAAYGKSVCVPTDYLTERPIVEFISKVAKECPGILFMITPRNDLSDHTNALIAGMENIKVIKGYPFQEVVRHCSLHTATDSTCCLEALAMGVPNILINTDNKAYELFGGLVDGKFTKFVSTPEEYIDQIKKDIFFRKEDIKASNGGNFTPGYQQNVDKALKKIKVDYFND